MNNNYFYIYILTTTQNTALYTGVTNNLIRRVYEHKNDFTTGFTKKYHVHKLVYYETGESILSAIERERQIKSWRREKKNEMINAFNPDWHDLYDELIREC
jgi:putative endonuclease